MDILSNLIFSIVILIGIAHARPNNHHETNIIGGRPARQGEIPYILSLQVDQSHHCGASIIEVQGVTLAICAAHCTLMLDDSFNVEVVAGELKHSDRTGIEQRVQVSRIVNHDFGSNGDFRNDISLLFLEGTIQFNDNVKPIALPPPGNISSGTVRVSGWGLTESDGTEASDDLMTVNIPVVTDEECARAYDVVNMTMYEDFLCAGKMGEGGADACQMDSGGPAEQDGKLVGIVSFGFGCGLPDYPGIYTETAFFLDWINENVAMHKRVHSNAE